MSCPRQGLPGEHQVPIGGQIRCQEEGPGAEVWSLRGLSSCRDPCDTPGKYAISGSGFKCWGRKSKVLLKPLAPHSAVPGGGHRSTGRRAAQTSEQEEARVLWVFPGRFPVALPLPVPQYPTWKMGLLTPAPAFQGCFVVQMRKGKQEL